MEIQNDGLNKNIFLMKSISTDPSSFLIYKIKGIVRKKITNRTDHENSQLINFIFNEFQRAQININFDEIKDYLSDIEIVYFSEGTNIFESDKFRIYILLSGQLSYNNNSQKLSPDIDNQKKVNIINPINSIIQDSFLNKMPIVCTMDSEFLGIKNEIYVKSKAKLANKAIDDTLDFIQQNPIFEKFQKNVLLKYYNDFILKEYHKGETVIKKGTEFNYLYLLKTGELKLYTQVSPILKEDENKQRKNKSKTQEAIFHSTKIKYSRNASLSKVDENILLIMNPGQIIGDIELFYKIYCSYNVICNSQKAEIILIPKNIFLKLVDSGSEILKYVNNQINIKKDFINNRNFEANRTCNKIHNGYVQKRKPRFNSIKSNNLRNSIEQLASLREDSKIGKSEKPIWQKLPISKKDSKKLVENKLNISRARFSIPESNEKKVAFKMNVTQTFKLKNTMKKNLFQNENLNLTSFENKGKNIKILTTSRKNRNVLQSKFFKTTLSPIPLLKAKIKYTIKGAEKKTGFVKQAYTLIPLVKNK